MKETSNLGRVVDRERNVFRSRERGTFTFDPETGEFGPAPAGDWPRPAERLVLDFGNAWAHVRRAQGGRAASLMGRARRLLRPPAD